MRQQRTPRMLDAEQKRAQRCLGRGVRELRVVRELSQEELGFRATLHRNYVGAIERGELNPTFRTLRALANGLDVELSSLIRLYEERDEDARIPRTLRRSLASSALHAGRGQLLSTGEVWDAER
jgi:transcriptional regulator with XRE-family HTH domain